MSNGEEYEDPMVEAVWLAEQRDKIQQHLEEEGIQHGGIAPEPVWCVTPFVSIWKVKCLPTPGAPWWWAIGGDLPTDYLSGDEATDARSALGAFVAQWREVSDHMLRGEKHPTISMGPPETWPELGHLLSRRADILEDWLLNDEIW